MADKMRLNYNTEISMFNKGGYEAYVALIIILLRIAKKCKPSLEVCAFVFTSNSGHFKMDYIFAIFGSFIFVKLFSV